MARTSGVQLRTIAEVAAILDAAQIRLWLRGGWALDFHLGRVTREHEDIDAVSSLRHRARIRRLLHDAGFEELDEYPHPQLVLAKDGVDVSFIFVERRGGDVVVPAYEEWPFPDGAFPETPKTLLGVTARVVAAHALLHDKLCHEEWSGRPLRPKDHESIALLRELTGTA